jgi:hypothetical protein
VHQVRKNIKGSPQVLHRFIASTLKITGLSQVLHTTQCSLLFLHTTQCSLLFLHTTQCSPLLPPLFGSPPCHLEKTGGCLVSKHPNVPSLCASVRPIHLSSLVGCIACTLAFRASLGIPYGTIILINIIIIIMAQNKNRRNALMKFQGKWLLKYRNPAA